MKKKTTLFLWSLLTSFTLCWGQDGVSLTNYDILSIGEQIPSSPEASELGQYGTIDASAYNGGANVAIPIYSVPFEGKQIPLQLTYDSGGVRAAQEATLAGLSWNLSTNFGISRKIYGTTDINEYSGFGNGYVHNTIVMDAPAGATNPQRHNYDDILRVHNRYNMPTTEGSPSNALDTQPDLFTANIFGKSYTFILNKKIGNSTSVDAFVFDSQNVQITLNLNDFSFTLLDEDGFTYYFNTQEINTTFSSIQGDAGPPGDYDGALAQIFADGNRGNSSLITNWHLDQVVSPNGRTLDFNYTQGLNFTFPQYSFINKGEDGGNPIAIWPEVKKERQVVKAGHNVSTTVVENNYLSEIAGDFGKVKFNLDGRLDLSTGSTLSTLSQGNYGSNVLFTAESQIRACHGSGTNCGTQTSLLPSKLSSIQVEDYHGKTIVNAQLNQSYFNEDKAGDAVPERYLRLKLDGINVNDKNYAFSYINPNSLPAKDSDGIDFWGFANGKEDANDGTVPRIGRFVTKRYNFPGNSSSVAQQFVKYDGADRRSRFNFAKAGLLNGVIYPTGGATELIYEPHDIVMATPRAFEETIFFNDYPERFRWTDMTDEKRFNSTYHFLKNAKNADFDYFEYENPSLQGDAITLDYRLNEIFNVDFNSVIKVETYLRTETGAEGVGYWGGTVLLAVEEVNTGTQYDMLYYGDAPTTNGSAPVYKEATVAVPPGSYRLVRRTIYVPDGDYDSYPPTPGISTNATRLLLDTYEADDANGNAVLERFEVGGARVKRIVNMDVQGDILSSKVYEYGYPDGLENLNSSGALMDELILYSKTRGFYSYSPRGTGDFNIVGQNRADASPSAQGSHIGYSFVREYAINVSGERLGWIDRNFHNLPNKYYTESFDLPFTFDGTTNGVWRSSVGNVFVNNTYVLGIPLEQSYAHANGNVLEEKVYDADGLLKQKTQNEYVYLNGNTLPNYYSSFKSYSLIFAPTGDSNANLAGMTNLYNTTYGPWGSQDETYFSYRFPQHYGQVSKLYETKTLTYDEGPELVKENITGYDGDTHHMRFNKMYNSHGELDRTELYYPYDTEVASQLGIADLLNENQLSAPVRTEVFLEDQLLSSQRNNYANNADTGNNTLPVNVSTFKGIPGSASGAYEERVNYEKFGPFGTIRQYRSAKGVPIVLIWGYKHQYVVAQITNALYADVATTANQITALSDQDDDRTKGYTGKEGALRQALDNLRASLTNAQMVSYTYDPLIGVTSTTDTRGEVTYYEYDTDNRLVAVKDPQEDLLQDFDYEYSDAVFDLSFSESPYTDPDPEVTPGDPGNLRVSIAFSDSGATYQTFVAQPSGGSGNYTYRWYRSIGANNTSFETSPAGTGSTYTLDVRCDEIRYVKLEVTSDGDTSSSTRRNGNYPCGPGQDPDNPE